MINWKKNYGKLFQIEFFKSFRTKSAMRNWLTSQPDKNARDHNANAMKDINSI